MGFKSVISVVLTAVVVWRIWKIAVFMQPWKVVYNHSPGPCQLVPQIENGSENMQLLPNGKVLLTSGLKMRVMEANTRMMQSPGQFYIFDFNSPEGGAKVVPCNNFPDYATEKFGPHGLDVFEHNGETLVFVVNHPPENQFERDTVEKFRFDPSTNSLTHLKTYSSEYFYITNDVIAVGPESFYITNTAYSRHPLLMILEAFLLFLPWSNVVFYDNGKTTIVADGLNGANGINASPDLRYIYTVTAPTNDIKVYARKSDGTLEFKQSKMTPTTVCDNIDVEQETGDLWLGCHPVAYKLGLTEKHSKPSQVLRIRTKDGLLTDDVTEVYANEGWEMEASSSAVYHKQSSAMLVGSVDVGMLHCKINHLR